MADPKVEPSQAALLVVDMQEDFCPSGTLAVTGGRDIAQAINSLLDLPFVLKIGTKDWHPADHVSFDTSHASPDVKAFHSTITISNPEKASETQDIPVWPVHCVQNTPGAEIIPEINTSKINIIVEKGKDPRVEMFSAFADVFGRKGDALSSHDVAALLRDAQVKQVFVTGLAGDCCVFHTALDAGKEGFEVFIVKEAIKSVDTGDNGWVAAEKKLQAAGVNLVSLNGPEIGKFRITA